MAKKIIINIKEDSNVCDRGNQILREESFSVAREVYGVDLPPVVKERLELELSAIENSNSSILYLISKLIATATPEGKNIVVNPLGELGSLLIPFLLKITHGNPLPPHYFCPNCDFVDFDSEGVQAYAGRAGCDMPDRVCPICGKKLKKDGFDISPEIALALNGKRVPIFLFDLSQKYISYFSDPNHFESILSDYIQFVDVSFSDKSNPGDTSRLHISLRVDPYLDLLERCQSNTQMRWKEIPFDSEAIFSLFQSPAALGITSDDIGGFPYGTLEIPDFNTEFMARIIQETKPESFDDLIRLTGISFGDGVWLDNARDAIREGRESIKTVTAFRDDVYFYLRKKGMSTEDAFSIMQRVRKGWKASSQKQCAERDQLISKMVRHGISVHYLESIQKIQYVFPRAMGVCHTIIAWALAYYKLYFPAEYYAAYISVFMPDLKTDQPIREKTNEKFAEYSLRKDSLNMDEEKEYRNLRVLQEMYARGIVILGPDIL